MTGQQWLDRVFAPAIAAGDPVSYAELAGALRALTECGVLSPEQARQAQHDLDARFTHMAGHQQADVAAPGSRAPAATDVLQGVLTPAAPLADIDQVTVIVVSVELWSTGLVLRLAGLRSALTDQLDADHTAATSQWVRTNGEAPSQPGARLLDLPLTIADDVGTRYRSDARSAGGTGTEWRSDWQFRPAVPADAAELTIAIGGDRGRHSLTLAVPARA